MFTMICCEVLIQNIIPAGVSDPILFQPASDHYIKVVILIGTNKNKNYNLYKINYNYKLSYNF